MRGVLRAISNCMALQSNLYSYVFINMQRSRRSEKNQDLFVCLSILANSSRYRKYGGLSSNILCRLAKFPHYMLYWSNQDRATAGRCSKIPSMSHYSGLEYCSLGYQRIPSNMAHNTATYQILGLQSAEASKF